MVTLAQAWELYHATILSNTSDRSIVTETGHWNNYIVPFIDQANLEEITALDIVKLRSCLQKKI